MTVHHRCLSVYTLLPFKAISIAVVSSNTPVYTINLHPWKSVILQRGKFM